MRFRDHDHPEDLRRMVAVCAQNGATALTVQDAVDLWEAYSESLCAGWLTLPQDDATLWSILRAHRPDLA